MTAAEIALAIQLGEQGIQWWTDFQNQAKAGTLTPADLKDAADKLDLDIAQLAADIAAQKP